MAQNNTRHSSGRNTVQRTRKSWALGRVDRLGFLFGLFYAASIYLVYAGLMLAITLTAGIFSSLPNEVVVSAFNGIDRFLVALAKVLFAIAVVSLAIRRLHDVEFSGWLLLLAPIPLVNLVLLGCLLLAPGKEPNKYGPPLRSLRFWAVLGFK